METLTLNNGTILENSNAHRDGERLYVYIQNGSTMAEVFGLLNDPEKTEKIIKKAPEMDDQTFNEFKKLIAVTDQENGMITAVLKKVYSEE